MTQELTRQEIQNLLAMLPHALVRDECMTCECMQGFLTQLETDTGEDITNLVAPFKAQPDEMNPCLGCDPCPPAELYADYLRGKNLENL